MKEKILTLNYVKDRMNAKLLYDKSNKLSQSISSDFDVQRWSSFLPPLHNFTVSRIDNVGVEFERLLKQAIINDDSRIILDIWRSLYGKLCSYSFGIIEAVQRAVNKEPLLLETMDGIPFLENACCNEGGANTNNYFSNKESSIRTHNEKLFDLEKLYYKYNNLHKISKIFHSNNTKIVFPRIQKEFSETTIYLAFIKFCKFNSGITLNDTLKGICLENNAKYKNVDSLEKK